jgi:hypothetical protein
MPKQGFFVLKYTIWQPWFEVERKVNREVDLLSDV